MEIWNVFYLTDYKAYVFENAEKYKKMNSEVKENGKSPFGSN